MRLYGEVFNQQRSYVKVCQVISQQKVGTKLAPHFESQNGLS